MSNHTAAVRFGRNNSQGTAKDSAPIPRSPRVNRTKRVQSVPALRLRTRSQPHRHVCRSTRPHPRSPKTSRPSSRRSANRAIAPTTWRRCRSPPTRRCGHGRSRLPRASSRARCRRGTSTRQSASRSSRTIDPSATTVATFGAPGEYILRLQANDQTGDGGGGFQCCWTNAYVSVSVKPPKTTVP